MNYTFLEVKHQMKYRYKNRFKPGTKIHDRFEELMENPLYAPSGKEEKPYIPQLRDCLAGNMPKGDFSGRCFLGSKLCIRMQRKAEEI